MRVGGQPSITGGFSLLGQARTLVSRQPRTASMHSAPATTHNQSVAAPSAPGVAGRLNSCPSPACRQAGRRHGWAKGGGECMRLFTIRLFC